MTSQFYARSHALICTCPKTAFSAPYSTSSPHLAQTEKVRLTRFFALPDSNTSPRVAIGVLGHVVVSQMGILQVPYATVTLKYFRALICHYNQYVTTTNMPQLEPAASAPRIAVHVWHTYACTCAPAFTLAQVQAQVKPVVRKRSIVCGSHS